MHWADRSTQDLAVACRDLQGPVCLVLTFRTDELTRRHPLRRALVEIGRSARRAGSTWRPSTATASPGSSRRAPAAPTLLSSGSCSRGRGNPLYAEELLRPGHRAPGPLSDLLLARVDALSAATRDLLRIASADGSRLDPPCSAEIAESTGRSMLPARGVDANVLRVTGDHLDFRHGLLREAVYDDCCPASAPAPRPHARPPCSAASVTGPGPAELGLLAFHWYAAHDLPAASRASVRAGLAARTCGGPEAVAHLERAFELYDQVRRRG